MSCSASDGGKTSVVTDISMEIFLAVFIQLTGFYMLYCTSARAVFVKHRYPTYLHKYRKVLKVLGSLLLLASFVLLMLCRGIGVGFFFALISLMSISACIIILVPLQKLRQ